MKEYEKERWEICKKCPLNNNGICNPRLFYNPTTGDVDTKAHAGYYSGCNCRLKFKIKAKGERCPAKRW